MSDVKKSFKGGFFGCLGVIVLIIVICIVIGAIASKGDNKTSSTTSNSSSTSSTDTSNAPATTADAGKVEVKSQSEKTNALGNKEIVGEVINNGTKAATFVKVTGTFYDKNNTVVDTEFTYAGDTDSTALQPQATTPFDIMNIESAYDHFKLDVTWN